MFYLKYLINYYVLLEGGTLVFIIAAIKRTAE